MSHRLLSLSLLLVAFFAARLPAQSLEIIWVDVEGGAATLMITPGGDTVLIDTGNPGRRDPERIFKAVTAAGKRRIDHLVVTHYHGDHYGGAAPLSELLPIGTVYDNAEWEGMPEKPDKVYREFKCEKRVQINPGDKLPVKRGPQDESVHFEIVCLGTRQQFIEPTAKSATNEKICASAATKDRDGSDNANSVVLLVKYGEFRFFDAGDLTWNQETKLVCPNNLVGKVDVYQTTHHGLDASNNPLVLQTIQPRVAIMNNGTTKGCMPEVFTNLKEQKTINAIYQMHKNLRPDGEKNNTSSEYIANPEKECAANTIQLSVATDGQSYTVSIPANKHTRKFETTAK
jgi:beta-lactamase superfamily II metal-dependent hydrolase